MGPDSTSIDFAAFGIPEHIARVLRQREYPAAWARYLRPYIALLLGIILLGVAVPLVLIFVSLQVANTRAEGAIFYDGDLGYGAGLVMLGSILCSAWIAMSLDRLFPARFREYLWVRGFEHAHRQGGLALPMTRWLYRRAARGITAMAPGAFLDAQAAVVRRWTAVATTVLLLGGASVVPFELSAYHVGTERSIERHSLFGVEHVPYDAVEHIEVGCVSHGRRAVGTYDLVLDDGERIAAFGRVCCGETLGRLTRLDHQLREAGVVVRAVTDDEGHPLSSPRCERQLAERTGARPAQLHALLSP